MNGWEGGTGIVCTSGAERWCIGRSIKYAARTVRTVHTTFRRRLRADRSTAAAASESAYCGCVTMSARRVRCDAAYQHDVQQDASLRNERTVVRACVRDYLQNFKRPSLQRATDPFCRLGRCVSASRRNPLIKIS